MNRRAFLFAALATSAATAPVRAASGLQVIYVGGWDCPYCITWQKDHKPAWTSSPEFKRVAYVEVDPPHLREAYQERYWPGDLKAILEQIPRKSGTPRFLIVKDGRIVSNEFGVTKWAQTMTQLKKLLG